ncbi:hypothetical protein [Tenacibaculum maritimum]|uniref:hypothetical protein n=1 Tax=Tenacibaculum maritimum TaxID=107401 RepID=UPI0010A49ABF|nr:hypothetical protein [Tenacibaculum maritimum]QCD61615.1 hypothetical protein B9C57_03205 [Tenacibaculum maritimum]
MKYGIYTIESQLLRSEYYSENPSFFLKRNAILFDKLVIADGSEVYGFDKLHYLNGASKEDIKNKSDLEKILLSIKDFVSDDNDEKPLNRQFNYEDSMWGGENSSDYIEFVCDYYLKKVGKNSISELGRYEYKELQRYIGGISRDFQILSHANEISKDFSALFSEIHEKAFRHTYQNEKRFDKGNVIREIEKINFIDFGCFSWDEIIILRKSEFIKDFRLKIFDWTTDFLKTKDLDKFQSDLNKFITDAKFDFIDRKKPDLKTTSILGILGNIPLPIPVNPVSLVSSAKEIRDEIKIKKDFDWLFFIQKAYKMTNA